MRSHLIQLLVTVAFLSTCTVAEACWAEPSAQPSEEEESVALQTELTEPHFYFRARFVIVFVPVEFVANYRNKYTGRPFPLAEELMRAAPLEEHTNIFKSIILGSERLTRVEAIVADALERGSALVYSPEMGRFASKVRVVTYNEVCLGGRRFYYDNGRREHNQIMSINDWIT